MSYFDPDDPDDPEDDVEGLVVVVDGAAVELEDPASFDSFAAPLDSPPEAVGDSDFSGVFLLPPDEE